MLCNTNVWHQRSIDASESTAGMTIAKEGIAHPGSLLEIEHRQFNYGHLIIVNDDLFSILIKYDKIVHQNISINWPAEDKHKLFNIVFDNCVSQINEVTSPTLEVLTSKVMRPPLLTYLHTCYKEIGIRINSTYGARKKLASQTDVTGGSECSCTLFTNIRSSCTVYNTKCC